MSTSLSQSYENLQKIVINNLTNAADWTAVAQYTLHPRPVLVGYPPAPLYQSSSSSSAVPTREYVLPMDLREKWTLRQMAAVFDALPPLPAPPDGSENGRGEWENKDKKRLLMAVVGEDSTIVYYFIHDGVVKPRQN